MKAAKAARLFHLASGAILALVALLGFALVAAGRANALGVYMLFDPSENVLHAVMAALLLGAGVAPLGEALARKAAAGFGIALLALAVLGFINGDLFGYPDRLGWTRFHLDMGENLLHLILGGWGAYVGTQEETVD